MFIYQHLFVTFCMLEGPPTTKGTTKTSPRRQDPSGLHLLFLKIHIVPPVTPYSFSGVCEGPFVGQQDDLQDVGPKFCP
jgi:hypothetical protein